MHSTLTLSVQLNIGWRLINVLQPRLETQIRFPLQPECIYSLQVLNNLSLLSFQIGTILDLQPAPPQCILMHWLQEVISNHLDHAIEAF